MELNVTKSSFAVRFCCGVEMNVSAAEIRNKDRMYPHVDTLVGTKVKEGGHVALPHVQTPGGPRGQSPPRNECTALHLPGKAWNRRTTTPA
jgi:hypothetical protein